MPAKELIDPPNSPLGDDQERIQHRRHFEGVAAAEMGDFTLTDAASDIAWLQILKEVDLEEDQ
jgi:hypothetical protein